MHLGAALEVLGEFIYFSCMSEPSENDFNGVRGFTTKVGRRLYSVLGRRDIFFWTTAVF